MSTSFLVIVEFGAQKQRISLDTSSSYEDVLQQIYSLFKIDASYRSKYVLQRQDPLKFGSFVTVDEQSFRDDVRRHAANRSQQSVMRLRLVPSSSKSASKPTNGVSNGEKAWSTSSQGLPDDSDRTSMTSAATIDIKQLIKKCLSNLKETTDNIRLLDRCLHPEDYFEDDAQPVNRSSSQLQTSVSNNDINSQIAQTLPTSTIVDELVPALSRLMNVQQSMPSPPTVINQQIQPVPPTNNGASRPANKSFSNRLGMITPSNPASIPSVPETKPTPPAQPYKSPVLFQPSISSLQSQPQFDSRPKETPSILKPKCTVQLQQFPAGATVEGIVSVASNASYFFLQVIDQRKDEFDRLSQSLHEHYSNLDKTGQYRPSPGDFCVAMYTEDARWYRARIIRYLSDQTCEVFYIDYGNMEELPIELLHELLPAFTSLPARAVACTIAEILPPIGQEGWTKRATFAFASRCSNERVQAIVVDSTKINWPMHMVQLRVLKTQEDIGASLEDCKVARRVPNQEICAFWSNKIRAEQYILYNLPDGQPGRFPSNEQALANGGQAESANTLLSSSIQNASPTADGLTGEKTPTMEETNGQTTTTTTTTMVMGDEIDPQEPDQQATPEIEGEKAAEPQASTPSSGLNADATPFTLPSAHDADKADSISTGDESDDEKDSTNTPISSASVERPRMPIKEDVIVDTSLTPSTPLAKSWLPIEITHIETPTRFYLRYVYGPAWNLGNGSTPDLIDAETLPEKNAVLNELTQEMTECYNKHKRLCPGDSYDEGELVAVKSRLRWHRGRFIQYKPNIEFAHVFFVDYGFTRSLPIQMIRPINNRFVLHAEQAHLVHLHQPGQRRGRMEWSADAVDEFRELTKDGTSLYARIVHEPSTVELMSYDPLTKKWFSFYEHFVKHLHDHDRVSERTE